MKKSGKRSMPTAPTSANTPATTSSAAISACSAQ
jgi:hypothetical protein